MKPASRAAISFCLCLSVAQGGAQAAGEGSRTDEQTAPDKVTQGWLLTFHETEPGQEWRTYSQELDIARNARITRRFTTGGTYLEWTFWAGGRQIALEEGGMHGPTVCKLFDLASKRPLSIIQGCNDGRKGKPAWAKAVLDREEKAS